MLLELSVLVVLFFGVSTWQTRSLLKSGEAAPDFELYDVSGARVANDFNGDGRPDIVWHNAQTGETQIWFMDASSRLRVNILPQIQSQEHT